jgi:hypothetical protein
MTLVSQSHLDGGSPTPVLAYELVQELIHLPPVFTCLCRPRKQAMLIGFDRDRSIGPLHTSEGRG